MGRFSPLLDFSDQIAKMAKIVEKQRENAF
jgi:hypothetical protein